MSTSGGRHPLDETQRIGRATRVRARWGRRQHRAQRRDRTDLAQTIVLLAVTALLIVVFISYLAELP